MSGGGEIPNYAQSEAGDFMSAAMMTISHLPRPSFNIHELFKKKEAASRMQVYDFKIQKYKRSSIFFWYKPPQKKEIGSGAKSGARSIKDENSSCG